MKAHLSQLRRDLVRIAPCGIPSEIFAASCGICAPCR